MSGVSIHRKLESGSGGKELNLRPSMWDVGIISPLEENKLNNMAKEGAEVDGSRLKRLLTYSK